MKACLRFFIYLCLLAGSLLSCSETYPPDKRDDFGGPDTTDLQPWQPDTIEIPGGIPFPELASSERFGAALLYEESELEIIEGIYYRANDHKGKEIALGYTFLAPAHDTLEKRPFILLVHEGAFLFGNRSAEWGKALSLARRGFAVAIIDYRLGFPGASESNACGSTTRNFMQAVYRSVQDIYAALGFFLDDTNKLGLDPRQVFLGGSSAGAIATSSAIYVVESEFDRLSSGISASLGPLRQAPLPADLKIRAQLTYLGYTIFETGYANTGSACPTLFFQNSGDNVLPYRYGPIFSCYIWAYGARAFADRLKNIKAPYEINYEPLNQHTMNYDSDYIAERYALFIKRLWQGDYRQIENERFKNILDQPI